MWHSVAGCAKCRTDPNTSTRCQQNVPFSLGPLFSLAAILNSCSEACSLPPHVTNSLAFRESRCGLLQQAILQLGHAKCVPFDQPHFFTKSSNPSRPRVSTTCSWPEEFFVLWKEDKEVLIGCCRSSFKSAKPICSCNCCYCSWRHTVVNTQSDPQNKILCC